jgi:hypothetical protein
VPLKVQPFHSDKIELLCKLIRCITRIELNGRLTMSLKSATTGPSTTKSVLTTYFLATRSCIMENIESHCTKRAFKFYVFISTELRKLKITMDLSSLVWQLVYNTVEISPHVRIYFSDATVATDHRSPDSRNSNRLLNNAALNIQYLSARISLRHPPISCASTAYESG